MSESETTSRTSVSGRKSERELMIFKAKNAFDPGENWETSSRIEHLKYIYAICKLSR